MAKIVNRDKDETLGNTPTGTGPDDDDTALPGVVVVFSGAAPRCEVFPLVDGALEFGRADDVAARLDDRKLSRRHASVRFDGTRWTVTDFDSRNGTFVDERPAKPTILTQRPKVIRMADTLLVPFDDVRPFRTVKLSDDEPMVAGAALHLTLRTIAQIARTGDTLHIQGESGSGKEYAAKTFHAASRVAAGPFVAINCAAIPEGVAERLLFGARRGAYSGAVADTEGYVQAANMGTLFLDEVAELDLGVQAKLLRVLETREVLQLGASKPQAVNIRICSATHRDLRAEVAAGRFREDLYFRLGKPRVALPPLRDRVEEIPWLVRRALRGVDPALAPNVTLVEATMLRPWPGNVRELLAEVRAAGQNALVAEAHSVEAKHLSDQAGVAISAAAATAPSNRDPVDRALVERALHESGGNVSAAARALGLHRNQLRRFIARFDIDPRSLIDRDDDNSTE